MGASLASHVAACLSARPRPRPRPRHLMRRCPSPPCSIPSSITASSSQSRVSAISRGKAGNVGQNLIKNQTKKQGGECRKLRTLRASSHGGGAGSSTGGGASSSNRTSADGSRVYLGCINHGIRLNHGSIRVVARLIGVYLCRAPA